MEYGRMDVVPAYKHDSAIKIVGIVGSSQYVHRTSVVRIYSQLVKGLWAMANTIFYVFNYHNSGL